MAAGEANGAVARRAARWLARTQRPDGTWDEPWYTGTGFPGYFYINYHLYRLVWPVSALGRWLAAVGDTSPAAAGATGGVGAGDAEPSRNMTGFFLLCPLPPEAAAAKAGLLLHERSRHGHAATDNAASGCVRIVGMGTERAQRACARLAASLPAGVPVVVLGVAGALTTGFEAGDLVVADAVGYADVQEGGNELAVAYAPRSFDLRSEAFGASLALALQQRHLSTRRAPVLTTTRTVRRGERAHLAGSSAMICDTESAALLPLAERRPFAVVRAIVDSPDRELVSLHTVTGGISALKRLADAARDPRRRPREPGRRRPRPIDPVYRAAVVRPTNVESTVDSILTADLPDP